MTDLETSQNMPTGIEDTHERDVVHIASSTRNSGTKLLVTKSHIVLKTALCYPTEGHPTLIDINNVVRVSDTVLIYNCADSRYMLTYNVRHGSTDAFFFHGFDRPQLSGGEMGQESVYSLIDRLPILEQNGVLVILGNISRMCSMGSIRNSFVCGRHASI